MSMIREEKVICPRCGKENYHVIWVSINGLFEPDAVRMLEDETLNDFVCSNCGKRIPFEDLELYLWMQQRWWYRLLIYLRNPEAAREYMEQVHRLERRRQRYEYLRKHRQEK